MREFAAGFLFGLTRPWRVLSLRSMTTTQLLAGVAQGAFLAALLLGYLAAAANPAPLSRPERSPEPGVVVHRPATEAEDAAWQRRQLELAIDEARRADQ